MTRTRYPPRPLDTSSRGRRANVHVPHTVVQYASMLERTKRPDADPADWLIDDQGQLFVSVGWFDHEGIGRWTRGKRLGDRSA